MQKIIGINPVTEALRSDKNIEKLEVYKKIKKDTIKEMFNFIEKHGIKPRIAKIFTLNEISLAHKFLETNSANGKVIVEVK